MDVFFNEKIYQQLSEKYLQYTRWGYILYVKILIAVKIKDKEKGMAEDKKCCCKKRKNVLIQKKAAFKQIKKNRRPDKGNIWYG